MHLLLALLEKELCLSDDLLTLFQCLVDLSCRLENTDVVSIRELSLLLFKEFRANVCLLVEFLRFELDVDEVCVFQ